MKTESGSTGISVLDESDSEITIEQFTLALKTYQQRISSANLVCRNLSSHCSSARATFDTTTGILNLPTVLVFQPIIGQHFKNAKMKTTGDNPITFSIIEVDNYQSQ